MFLAVDYTFSVGVLTKSPRGLIPLTLLNLSTIIFQLYSPNILSGETHHKGGGLKLTSLLPYYLHPNLNQSSLILLHLRNLKCLLNPSLTQTTRKTSYLDYDVEIQEINLHSRIVLTYNYPHSPPEEIEEEEEYIFPHVNPPPFPERLIHPI